MIRGSPVPFYLQLHNPAPFSTHNRPHKHMSTTTLFLYTSYTIGTEITPRIENWRFTYIPNGHIHPDLHNTFWPTSPWHPRWPYSPHIHNNASLISQVAKSPSHPQQRFTNIPSGQITLTSTTTFHLHPRWPNPQYIQNNISLTSKVAKSLSPPQQRFTYIPGGQIPLTSTTTFH